MTVTIHGQNDIPDAVDDVDDADEDGPAITIDVLANDSDADLSDVLSVDSLNTSATLGSVTNNGTDVTYDPNGAFESLAVGETATDTLQLHHHRRPGCLRHRHRDGHHPRPERHPRRGR